MSAPLAARCHVPGAADAGGAFPHHAELVPNELHALGGTLDLRRSYSFADPQAEGLLPAQCYLLRRGREVLLIDGGMAIHGPQIRAALETLVAPNDRKFLYLTRREPDAVMNMPWLVSDFGWEVAYARGELNPMAYFDSIEEVLTDGFVRATSGLSITWLADRMDFPLGDTRLELIRAPVSILATNWLYDAKTATLFSSDLWGMLPRRNALSVAPADDAISPEAIHRHLRAKFDWLCGIDTQPMIDQVRAIEAVHRPQRICPSYGCVIAGEASVRLLFRNTAEALARIGREPRVPAAEDAFWARLPAFLHDAQTTTKSA